MCSNHCFSVAVVSAERSYDAFGNVVSASCNWKSQFGYAGKFGYQSDPDTGLKLLRASVS